MIGIVDYGAGNLCSVKKAFDYLDSSSRVVQSSSQLRGVDRLVLPGVGAFQSAVQRLNDEGLFEHIVEWIRADSPFLGICLGLQLLFELSEEAEGVKGMGIFRGTAKRFREKKVPQIGWNQVRCTNGTSLRGLQDGAWFYFLHGYYIDGCEPDIVAGTTEYGAVYPSVITRGNLLAVQFHPEKSGKTGMKFLMNWMTR